MSEPLLSVAARLTNADFPLEPIPEGWLTARCRRRGVVLQRLLRRGGGQWGYVGGGCVVRFDDLAARVPGTTNNGGMTMNRRKALIGLVMAGGLTLGVAAPAFAGDSDHHKCNSGRGNGSEATPATDCDPGNSGGNNNGGD